MSAPDRSSRRDFLRRLGTGSLAAAAALPALRGALACATRGEHVAGLPFDPEGGAPPRACAPTEDNIEGPFYRPGAPKRANLVDPALALGGTPLTISGVVNGPDCRPLAGALLDVWQADPRGRYDNDDADHPPARDSFILRGRLYTDAAGRYEMRTLVPGHYRIGPKQWRPAHVHVKASGPGTALLTTQLYFAGDPYFEGDPFWHASLILGLTDASGGGKAGTFDFFLMKG
jgi:hypothetical protein